MAKNFKIADIKNNTLYNVSLIDNWDGSAETKTMTGDELKSFTNAVAHLYDIHATEITPTDEMDGKKMKEKIINQIIEFFKENEEIFENSIEELDSYNGYLGDGRYYYMEDINEFYSDTDPIDLLYRVFYGYDEDTYTTDGSGNEIYSEFNPNRTYFHYNGYGNLVSSDYRDYTRYLDHYVIAEMNENRRYIDSIENNDELAALFDALGECEKTEV